MSLTADRQRMKQVKDDHRYGEHGRVTGTDRLGGRLYAISVPFGDLMCPTCWLINLADRHLSSQEAMKEALDRSVHDAVQSTV